MPASHGSFSGEELAMDDKDLRDKLDFNAGQMQALMTFVGAFIAMHADRVLAQTALASTKEVTEARLVPMSVPEQYLEGSRFLLDQLQRSLDSVPVLQRNG
jgi:hypothetical protein